MLSKEELDALITNYMPSHRMYIKFFAVREVLYGKTRPDMIKNLHVIG